MRVLLIDNYDSFTWNLAQLLMGLQAEVRVVRNDAIDLAGIDAWRPDRLVLSPGPGRPERAEDFGICAAVLQHRLGAVPLLGVCLGHQGLVHALGGQVVHAPEPMHGKVAVMEHHGGRLLDGLPRQFKAMRYHSLLAERAGLPACLRIVAETAAPAGHPGPALVMAVEHRTLPVYGVQFHPESIGTPQGADLMANFLSERAAQHLDPEPLACAEAA
jgi:anthranilate synthase component 2